MRALHSLILTSAIAALPLLAGAQSTLIYSAKDQNASMEGNWHPSTTAARVGGLPQASGTMVLLPGGINPGDSNPLELPTSTLVSGETLLGSISFDFSMGETVAPHIVSVAAPLNASRVRSVLLAIESPGGSQEIRFDFRGTMGDEWRQVATLNPAPAGNVTLRFVIDEASQPPDPFSPAVFALSGVRVSSDDSMMDDPFAAVDSEDPFLTPTDGARSPSAPSVADDPFAVSSIDDDPFAAPTVADDPFAAPSVTDDPFAAPTVADDPFAAPPVNDDPFAAPAVADDPFAVNDDPFAAVPTPGPSFEAQDPFAGQARAEVVAPAPTPAPTPRATPAPTPTPAPVQLLELDFHPTIDAARAAARESGRSMLIIFTGEGRRASEFDEALRHPSMSPILADFEMVQIDYRSNRDIAREFSVRQFPYIVVLSSRGFTEDHIIGVGSQQLLAERLRPHMGFLARR